MKFNEHLNNLRLAAAQKLKEKEYWTEKLSGDPRKSFFPYSNRDKYKEKQFHRLEFNWKGDIFSKAMALSQDSHYTLHMLLAAALEILLAKYNDCTDVVIGTPVYRQESDTEMINRVVGLRNWLQGQMTFKAFLLQVRETINEAIENYAYPVELLPEALNIPFDRTDDFPLFDTIIQVNTIHHQSYYKDIRPYINMIFSFNPTEDCLEGQVEYNSLLYEKPVVEQIVNHLENILHQTLFNLDIQLRVIEILSPLDKKKLLCEFDHTGKQFTVNKTIDQLFQEQVLQTPHHIAVAHKGSSITYEQLDKHSDLVARMLRAKGLGPGTACGILLERSIDMIAAILGTLKAGGAYLPLDSKNPTDRLLQLMDDSRVPCLLTDSHLAQKHHFTLLQENSIDPPRPYRTMPRPQIEDLDHLPIPDRTLIDFEKYNQYIGQADFKNVMTLQATRGCPYKCVYCHKIWPKTHVIRSAQHILEEVKMFYDLGVRRFAFIDDIFNLNRENSQKFFQLVIKNRMDIQIFFPNGVRSDLLTEDYIDLMVEAGVTEIALALETASPRLQKLIKKNMNLEKLHKNCQYFCKKYPEVFIKLFTMVGFPTETEEEAMMTLDFIKSLKWLHWPFIFVLKIYPNTDMAELALKHGISMEAIRRSIHQPYHELPDTLPFDKSFVLKYQTDFFQEYFLSKERLLHVLPYQLKKQSESELVQHYSGYLPIHVDSLANLLEFLHIKPADLEETSSRAEDTMYVPHLNEKLKTCFPPKKIDKDAFKVLILDLSNLFTSQTDRFEFTVEPPLGPMYVLTYLRHCFGSTVNGRIAKASMDFNSFAQLRELLEQFQPHLIGMRTLSIYKNFLHTTAALIRAWGINVPIVTGGPYATSSFASIVRDPHIDLVVMGEGEETLAEIVEKMLENDKKMPHEEVLKTIKGIAFLPGKPGLQEKMNRDIILVDLLEDEFNRETSTKPAPLHHPDNLAYIIYTSGSTGKPKGVPISHANLSPLLHWGYGHLDIGPGDRALQNLSYYFDWSVWEIFINLTTGASLHMVADEVLLNPALCIAYMNENKITVLHITPTQWKYLVDFDQKPGTLKYLFIGAEKLTYDLVRRSFDAVTEDCRVFNMYGPTEATIISAVMEIHRTRLDELKNLTSVPIGQPAGNTALLVLDRYFNLCPPGVAGELYIAGDGLALGYLNNSAWTAEKFVINPRKPGQRLYRSGDLVRCLDNGSVEFLRRIDDQVKIRGFRIELGEIENQLSKHEDIKESVVIEKHSQNEDKYLSAYIVPKVMDAATGTVGNTGTGIDIKGLRSYLARSLPEYMIPTHFEVLDKIPLNPNGKVDRKALEQEGQILDSGGKYIPPRDDTEKQVASVWQKVLSIKQIGINDNFIEMGGDSIKVIELSAAFKGLGWLLDMKEFFTNPFIKDHQKYLKPIERQSQQGIITGEVELTPIQRWFFEMDSEEKNHFNHYLVYWRRTGLDPEIVKKVFTKIVDHHDALRMVYEVKDGKIIQENRGLNQGKLFDFETIDLRSKGKTVKDFKTAVDRMQRGISLQTGPLVKLGLFHTSKRDILVVVIHHAVIDGISWRILIEDFNLGYKQASEGEEIKLPDKTDSFRFWAKKIKEYATSEKVLKELDYWKKIEEAAVEPLPTKGAPADGKRKEKNRESHSINLDKEITGKLLRKVNWAYNTNIKDILLTALGRALKEWSGNEQTTISMEGHGREQLMDNENIDISRTMGWFTTQYPILLDMTIPGGKMDVDQQLAHQITQVKKMLRSVPKGGIGYGILKYLTPLQVEKNSIFKLEPQIVFNYLGQ